MYPPDIARRKWRRGSPLLVNVIAKSFGQYEFIPCIPKNGTSHDVTQIADGKKIYYISSILIENGVWLHTFTTDGLFVHIPPSFFEFMDTIPFPVRVGILRGAQRFTSQKRFGS